MNREQNLSHIFTFLRLRPALLGWSIPINHQNRYFYLTIFLLIAFFAQDAFDLEWPWLVEQQQGESYKRWSGLLLMLVIAAQWSLSVLRTRGQLKAAKRHYHFHQKLGAFTPLFFYLHSTELGYAYLFLLSSVYFTNIIVGLFDQKTLGIKKHRKKFSYYWMILHVTLSVLVVVLMIYHIFISFYYK